MDIKQKILKIILKGQENTSSKIHLELNKGGLDISLITTKRALQELVLERFIVKTGKGRSVKYEITTLGRLNFDIDASVYCKEEPDKRYGNKKYNFDLFKSIRESLFNNQELEILQNTTSKYHSRILGASETIKSKELERFIIELSWKSSKIEGNTYSLLDTERLIKEGVEAFGHSKDEATMILNHKKSLKFILENKENFKNLSKKNIEELHRNIVEGLNVEFGLRSKLVGITGSLYTPLDNVYQIEDALNDLMNATNKIIDPFSKALLILLGLSYIQPFEDGNKRTSRLLTNAILIINNCAPLSYRSVDENTYKEALLVFYELNSIIPFKKIFIEQYLFATENYLV